MLDVDRNAAAAKSKDTLSATVERVVTDKVSKMEIKLEAKLDKLLGEISSNRVEAKDGRRKKFKKCDECEKSGAYCKHCVNCGKLGHKKYHCPDPPKDEKNE